MAWRITRGFLGWEDNNALNDYVERIPFGKTAFLNYDQI